MGKNEYLVDGALLMCINGSERTMLKVTEGHGYLSGGKNKANCKDCLECKNISYFGNCCKNKKTHKCEGFMKLASNWENTSVSTDKMEKINNEDAITMDSVLLCKKGGIIIPVTSGQEKNKGINFIEFYRRFENVLNWVKGRNLMCCEFSNDPVNINTGNYIYEKEDIIIPGIAQISFKLFYNSLEKGKGGCLGEGWHHNYEMHIRKEQNKNLVYLCFDDGQEQPYRYTIGDIYSPVMGGKGILKKECEEFRYYDISGSEYVFDKHGLLLSKVDRYGNTNFFFHNNKGQLVRVLSASGGELYYTYNKEGNLIRVKDHTGREVQLWYRYKKLWKFINTLGYAYTYEYNEEGKIESVVTPRGVVGVFNEYDSLDRVVKQIMANGSVIEFMYDDINMRTYMKNPNGNVVIYERDERFRNVKTIYTDGEESFGYNDKNQRILYIDKNGNKTRYKYDQKGNLIETINPLGQIKEFTYDSRNRLLTVSSGGKILRTNIYDRKGQLIKTTDAIGRTREAIYDEEGLLQKIVQSDGSSILIEHDNKGNIVNITDCYGNKSFYEYDNLNRVNVFIDSEGNKTCYKYNSRNQITKLINQNGNCRNYVYDESENLIEIVDFDGRKIVMEYSSMNKPIKIIDKQGRVTLKKYDVMGNIAEEISPLGAVTTWFYDRNNRLEKVEMKKAKDDKAATVISTYNYDSVGNLLSIRIGDEEENYSEVSYVYDVLNRIVAVTNPVGGTFKYTYNTEGHVSGIIDPVGNKRSFIYNAVGEIIESVDIYGNSKKYNYNKLGLVSSVIDGIGRITKCQYQVGGRLDTVVYPDGRKIKFTYDSLGRVKTRTYGNDYCLTYDYDNMGRVINIISNLGQQKSYTYDVSGNVTSMTDANGNLTLYKHSVDGKLEAVTDALGNYIEYTYDKGNNLIRIFQQGKDDEANREMIYERNSLGQIECIRTVTGNEEHFTYDSLGRIISKMDADGFQTGYSYAQDGKINSITYGDGRCVEFSYTDLRQLSSVKDWFGETNIERNIQGKPLRIVNHNGKEINYEWGKMGERKSITYSDGSLVKYRYDKLLRLEEMTREKTDEKTFKITYKYDGEGNLLEKQMPSGLCTRYKYDSHGMLKELVHVDERGILDYYSYDYDILGNRRRMEKKRRGLPKENGSYIYYYDALNRLEKIEKNDKQFHSYRYDSFGNRIEMMDYNLGIKSTYTYNSQNQLTEKRTWKEEGICLDGEGCDYFSHKNKVEFYSYDLRGNMVAEYHDNNLVRGYSYDAMNHLCYVWNEEGKYVKYQYNGLGQRIKRYGSDENEEYVLDLTKSYHNLLEIQKDGQCQNFYWDTNIIAMEDEGKIPRYYLNDELGSVLRVVYGTGNGDLYGYDEFGNDIHDKKIKENYKTHYSKLGNGQPFGYIGYCYDDFSETYFAQARDYKPEIGRFVAKDVMIGMKAVPNTLNRYGYCFANPLGLIDNTGEFPVPLIAVVAVAAFLCGCGSEDEQEPIRQIIEPQNNNGLNEPVETPIIEEPQAPDVLKEHLISSLDDYNVADRAELLELLKTMEHFEPVAYYATNDEKYKTIGLGHYCDDPTGADAKFLQNNYVMTLTEAENLMIEDLNKKIPEEMLNDIFDAGVSLHDYQIDALVLLSYTKSSLSENDSPKFHDYLVKGEYSEEATLNHWLTYTIQKDKNGQVKVLGGLVKRRVAEAMIFSGQGYPEVANGDFNGDLKLMKKLYDYATQFNLDIELYNRVCDHLK